MRLGGEGVNLLSLWVSRFQFPLVLWERVGVRVGASTSGFMRWRWRLGLIGKYWGLDEGGLPARLRGRARLGHGNGRLALFGATVG